MGGDFCKGRSYEAQSCNNQLCPGVVNGGWTSWFNGPCSATCGYGRLPRSRSCTNPAPANGGRTCSGSSRYSLMCSRPNCPNQVNGRWSAWGFSSTCSSTCGTGFSTRRRTCTNPRPANNGRPCYGASVTKSSCKVRSCPGAINGLWGSWGSWSTCSRSCGRGYRNRRRACDSPSPVNGGDFCSGNSYNSAACINQICPRVVNGRWSSWGGYSSCSKTCGIGIKQRIRTCTNPTPQNGGRSCPGSSALSTSCKVASCPGERNGGWSTWGSWGTCSVTCERGLRLRTRTCTNPAPANGGAQCRGGSKSSVYCNAGKCPGYVDGAWSVWGAWTGCSRTCGKGYNYRRRLCNNPTPKLGGDKCRGYSFLYSVCFNYNSANCPGLFRQQSDTSCHFSHQDLCAMFSGLVNGGWTSWTQWSSCSSLSCGIARSFRRRSCSNPRTANYGLACPGSNYDSRLCGFNLKGC